MKSHIQCIAIILSISGCAIIKEDPRKKWEHMVSSYNEEPKRKELLLKHGEKDENGLMLIDACTAETQTGKGQPLAVSAVFVSNTINNETAKYVYKQCKYDLESKKFLSCKFEKETKEAYFENVSNHFSYSGYKSKYAVEIYRNFIKDTFVKKWVTTRINEFHIVGIHKDGDYANVKSSFCGNFFSTTLVKPIEKFGKINDLEIMNEPNISIFN